MPLELLDPAASPATYGVEVERPTGDQEFLWTLNFGPQHPAMHTTLRLVLTLDGERIVKCVPDIGYLHSGFEKLGEDLDWNQYVTIVDRKNYISPFANEVAWLHTVEKLLGIELTPRCKYVRTICAELMRLHDHLLCIGGMALDLGGFTPFIYFFNQREKIYDIMEAACGQRYHHSFGRVGGLMYDVDDAWVRRVRDFTDGFPKAFDDVSRMLTKNRIFMERMRGIGVLTKAEAINRSCTGPVARASGVVRDVRKDEPYLAYGELDFQVVCASAGDCYARYMVRMREMLESIRIIRQACDRLPGGPVNMNVNGKAVLPDKTQVFRSIEGLIQHFEVIMPNRGVPAPVDEVYGGTESPNGELGYYVVSDGKHRGYRTRTRPPSFIHFSLFPHLIEGHQISDVVAVLGSLNIIAAELDR